MIQGPLIFFSFVFVGKASASIGLIIVLVWALIPVWEIQRLDSWRKEFKNDLRQEHLSAKNLDTLLLEKQDFSGVKVGSEIDVDQHRYDVIAIRESQNFYEVVVFRDDIEKKLLLLLGYRLNGEENSGEFPSLSILKIQWFNTNPRKVCNAMVSSQIVILTHCLCDLSRGYPTELKSPPEPLS